MPEFLDLHPQITYTGYDLVPALIAQNRIRYPGHKFEILDITTQVPRRADPLFSKDMLNHLSEAHVWAALENMVRSRPRYILLTTNRGFVNEDIWAGAPHASRHLDLESEPYSMPAPIDGDHYILIWQTESVERRLKTRRQAARKATR